MMMMLLMRCLQERERGEGGEGSVGLGEGERESSHRRLVYVTESRNRVSPRSQTYVRAPPEYKRSIIVCIEWAALFPTVVVYIPKIYPYRTLLLTNQFELTLYLNFLVF